MAPDTPAFQVYRGASPPRFAHPAELACARLLDFHGVPWEYEPRTFALEHDADGRVVEAITPDFYLPDEDVYLELTAMRQSLVTRKHRKLRKLRARHPEVRVRLLCRRDLELLAARYGLALDAA